MLDTTVKKTNTNPAQKHSIFPCLITALERAHFCVSISLLFPTWQRDKISRLHTRPHSPVEWESILFEQPGLFRVFGTNQVVLVDRGAGAGQARQSKAKQSKAKHDMTVTNSALPISSSPCLLVVAPKSSSSSLPPLVEQRRPAQVHRVRRVAICVQLVLLDPMIDEASLLLAIASLDSGSQQPLLQRGRAARLASGSHCHRACQNEKAAAEQGEDGHRKSRWAHTCWMEYERERERNK